MARVVQVTWTTKVALPDDPNEYHKLVAQMFEESDTEDIASDITLQGGTWSVSDVEHQLALWLVFCAQRGDFPCGPVEEDYEVTVLGTTPA